MRLLRLATWLVVLGLALPAEARRQREYPYAFDQVWNAALRLVRVDLRCAVTDRDPEGGYVLFEYESQGKRHPGSVELVRPTSGPGNTVVVVQVQGMPSYVEQMVLDRLDKKLLSEFGPPAKAPKPAPPPPAPKPPEDAGEAPAEPNP